MLRTIRLWNNACKTYWIPNTPAMKPKTGLFFEPRVPLSSKIVDAVHESGLSIKGYEVRRVLLGLWSNVRKEKTGRQILQTVPPPSFLRCLRLLDVTEQRSCSFLGLCVMRIWLCTWVIWREQANTSRGVYTQDEWTLMLKCESLLWKQWTCCWEHACCWRLCCASYFFPLFYCHRAEYYLLDNAAEGTWRRAGCATLYVTSLMIEDQALLLTLPRELQPCSISAWICKGQTALTNDVHESLQAGMFSQVGRSRWEGKQRGSLRAPSKKTCSRLPCRNSARNVSPGTRPPTRGSLSLNHRTNQTTFLKRLSVIGLWCLHLETTVVKKRGWGGGGG